VSPDPAPRGWRTRCRPAARWLRHSVHAGVRRLRSWSVIGVQHAVAALLREFTTPVHHHGPKLRLGVQFVLRRPRGLPSGPGVLGPRWSVHGGRVRAQHPHQRVPRHRKLLLPLGCGLLGSGPLLLFRNATCLRRFDRVLAVPDLQRPAAARRRGHRLRVVRHRRGLRQLLHRVRKHDVHVAVRRMLHRGNLLGVPAAFVIMLGRAGAVRRSRGLPGRRRMLRPSQGLFPVERLVLHGSGPVLRACDGLPYGGRLPREQPDVRPRGCRAVLALPVTANTRDRAGEIEGLREWSSRLGPWWAPFALVRLRRRPRHARKGERSP
jgi:hypothetical protein